MAAWLSMITSPLDSAGKALDKLIETRDLIKFGDVFRKLQGEILAAQRGAFEAQLRETELVERIRELEKEMTRFETWEAEKQRYQLHELAPNIVVYAVKESERRGEPLHYICANCYNAGKKQFLQQTIRGSSYDEYKCNGCGEKLPINKGTPPNRGASWGRRGGGGPNSWMAG